MTTDQLILFVSLGFFLILCLVFLTFGIGIGRTWLQAFLSGTPITLVSLIGMKLRRSDMTTIVEQCIACTQAGFPVSCAEMERAWLQKVDIAKVTLAYITSRKRDQDFSFLELVDAEREGRLESRLRS